MSPATLMPGTGHCAISDSIELTRAAVELGCAGVLMLPPFYYKGVSDGTPEAGRHTRDQPVLPVVDVGHGLDFQEAHAGQRVERKRCHRTADVQRTEVRVHATAPASRARSETRSDRPIAAIRSGTLRSESEA